MLKIKKQESVLKIIEKIINSNLVNVQIKYEQLKNLLSKEEIEKCLDKRIIEKNTKPPRKCNNCSNTEIDILDEGGSYYIKCKKCGSIYTESKIQNTYYHLHYLIIAEYLLNSLKFDRIQLYDEDYYISGFFEWKDHQFSFIFLPTIVKLDFLLSPFLEISKKRGNILCIITDKNFEEILKLYSFVTFGKTIKIVPISIFNSEEVHYWLDYSTEIKRIEDIIITDLKKERRELVISVNTNPKYVLTLLEHLKTLKQMKKGKFDYRQLEDMISVVIQQFYASDPTFGGGQSIGKSLPDNIFIVTNKNGDPKIFGLIDCKSSEIADPNRELTEKYLNYIKIVRKEVSRSLKVSMIFLVFNFKTNYILKFYDRIEGSLKDLDYIIIFPVDTLIIILEIYLNFIIQGEFRRKGYYDNFEYFLRKIFNNNYLNTLKNQYKNQNKEFLSKTKLFYLDPKIIFTEIKNRLKFEDKIKGEKILSIQEVYMKRYGKIE